MKKRKIKLFASVASLAMVAAVMGVGVWAATSQAVAVTSTVQFSAQAIAANVTLKVTGTEGEGANIIKETEGNYTYKTATEIANWAFNADEDTLAENTKTVDYQLVDGNENAAIDAGATIVYEFVITAASLANETWTASPVNVQYTVSVTGEVDEIFGDGPVIMIGEDEYEQPGTITANPTNPENANVTVKVIYTVEEAQASIDAGTKLGTINISLAGAGQ